MAHIVQGSNPRDHLRLPNYTWIWPANTLLLGTKPPFTNYDWPNPTPPVPPIIQNNIRVLVTPAVVISPMPFVQSDWPLPQTYPYVNYNYTEGLNVANLGSTLNPFSYEWNATPDVQPIDQTWIQSLVNTTLRPPPPPPFKQTDWPLPRSIFLPIDQFQSNSTNLLPATNTAKPFVQSDWPLPQAPWRLDQFIGSQIVLLFPVSPPPPHGGPSGGGRHIHHWEVQRAEGFVNEDFLAAVRQQASKGGQARAKSLSSNQRTAAASKAAASRWKK